MGTFHGRWGRESFTDARGVLSHSPPRRPRRSLPAIVRAPAATEARSLGQLTPIVREIAVALGGEIELEPRPGGGTVAAIVIERQQEPE